MTIGASPAAASVTAARIPAGPAPTTTGGLSVDDTSRHDPHVLRDEARARAQSRAVFERDPAILARAHQTKSRARPVTELRRSQSPPIGEERGQHRISRQRLAMTSVDDEPNARPLALGESAELCFFV